MTDSTRWYAVPGYGRQLPTVVNAAGELVCTCEELEDAKSIAADHAACAPKPNAPEIIGYKTGKDFMELSVRDCGKLVQREPPPECPPLPDGAVYAGRLGDYPDGHKVIGWIWDTVSGDWEGSEDEPWYGDKTGPECFWHYAKPANIEQGDAE